MHHLLWNWTALRMRQEPNKETLTLNSLMRVLQHGLIKLKKAIRQIKELIQSQRSHLDGILIFHPAQVVPMRGKGFLLLVWRI